MKRALLILFAATILHAEEMQDYLAPISHTISSEDDAPSCAPSPRECEKWGLALHELPSSKIEWQTNFDAALSEGKEQQLPLLLVFTGSDWCRSCQDLQQTILTKDDFAETTKGHFIFVNIDYPLHHRLSPKEIVQNQSLKKQFHIEGFPTFVILMPSSDTLMFAGNFPKTPGECGALFLHEVEKAKKLDALLCHIDGATPSDADLEELFNQARTMGRKDAMEALLVAGFDKREKPTGFFLKEKFRKLQEEGLLEGDAAKKIKEELLASDADNTKGHHLFVAICEFEALVKKKESQTDLTAANPLLSYLEQHGSDDTQNSWRVELMLAQFLRKAGQAQKAVKFAKAAYVKAPDLLKEEIQASISEMDTAH